jgi:3D (Asp-Asp-Asp) domain-containing protein
MPYKIKKIKKLAQKIEKELAEKLGFVGLIVVVFFSFNFPQHTIAYAQSNANSGEISISSASSNSIEEYSPVFQEKTLPVIQEKQPTRIMTVRVTAYNAEVAQTDSSPCITANGYNLCESEIEDTIATNFLEFGTKIKIPDIFGDKIFVVRDRMNARYGTGRMDIYMRDHQTAVNFSAKTVKIYIY